MARTSGVLSVNAAGNYRRVHWGGMFQPDAEVPDSHDWGAGGNVNPSEWCLPNGYLIAVELFWNDWEDVQDDYDLYLLEYDGTEWIVRDTSLNPQDGKAGQEPQEWIRYPVSGAIGEDGGCLANSGSFGIAVRKEPGAAARNLQVFAHVVDLGINVEERSLGFPADSPNVHTVAAIDVSSSLQESYSSEGPILAPGGGLPVRLMAPLSGPEKPDSASFANVDTRAYGRGVFNGTSAATPHVAGLAALVLQQNPEFTVDQLEAELIGMASSGANDLGAPGHDNEYGWGRMAFASTPTAVSLVSFTADRQAEDVLLRWLTATEIDNIGFNLYRAESADGEPTRLNSDLIAAATPGSPIGAEYDYLDRTAAPGASYYYWLETVGSQGQTARFGPALVRSYQQFLPLVSGVH
jgi:hypothetical protein